MKNDNRPRAYRKDTLLTHLGRNPEAQHGAINPPVYHASTILSKNIAEWESRPDPRTHFGVVRYGLSGTPTTFALEELLAQIEGGYRAAIVCSGLAAITAPLQGLLWQGDHLLMVDSAYGPARNFCNRVLTRMGVETTGRPAAIYSSIEFEKPSADDVSTHAYELASKVGTSAHRPVNVTCSEIPSSLARLLSLPSSSPSPAITKWTWDSLRATRSAARRNIGTFFTSWRRFATRVIRRT